MHPPLKSPKIGGKNVLYSPLPDMAFLAGDLRTEKERRLLRPPEPLRKSRGLRALLICPHVRGRWEVRNINSPRLRPNICPWDTVNTVLGTAFIPLSDIRRETGGQRDVTRARPVCVLQFGSTMTAANPQPMPVTARVVLVNGVD